MTYADTPRLILNDSPAIIKHKSCVLPPIFMFDYLILCKVTAKSAINCWECTRECSENRKKLT